MYKSLQLDLCDLPDDILLDVLDLVNIKSLQTVRFCSKRFSQLAENQISRLYRQSVHHHKQLDANSEASITFKVIDILIRVYRENGFSNSVTTFLAQLMLNAESPVTIKFADIRFKLLNFYKSLHMTLAMRETQKDQMMFLITLIILLKSFKKARFTEISKDTLLKQRTFEVRLPGYWFGVLWVTNKNVRSYIKNRHHVMVLLAELLISNLTSQELMNVMQFSDICYVYGYTKKESRQTRGMDLTITMNGSQQACDLLDSCIMSDSFSFEDFAWPKSWSPNIEYSVDIKINSKEVAKWGCLSEQLIEFHPFAETCGKEDYDEVTENPVPQIPIPEPSDYNTRFIGFRETYSNEENYNEAFRNVFY